MAVFAYTRVSTAEQNPENQKLEIQQSGRNIDYWFTDHGVSGSIQTSRRPELQKLLHQIRDGETLVVTKLDRLGRDAIDVGSDHDIVRTWTRLSTGKAEEVIFNPSSLSIPLIYCRDIPIGYPANRLDSR
jgi:DNA invertase Pin-like site-specific DNA recombinase